MATARRDECAWRPGTMPEEAEILRNIAAHKRVLRALAKRFGR